MPEFTVGERILLHLYNYRTVDLNDYFNIPWDITQDGISTSLRISRAHASLELKKQKEKGYIKDSLVRIYGGKVRRLAYELTELGIKTAVELQEKAKGAGIDVRTLTDVRRQDASVVLENLRDGDRFALGVACAFRVAVPMDALPSHEKSAIPTDVGGFTSITPDLKGRVMRAAGKDEIREWHSYAADFYADRGQYSTIPDEDCRMVERAYHLLLAERYIDACKVIEKNPYVMMLSDDKGFYEVVRDVPLDSIKDRFKVDFLMLKAELALSQRDLKTARETSEILTGIEEGQGYGYACLTECLILRGKGSEAKDTISLVNSSRNVFGMLKLAEAYVDLNDIPNAEEQLELARKYISDNNVTAVSQMFLVEARIDAAKGNIDDANRHISKAYNATNEIGRNNIRAVAKNLGLSISGEIVRD